MSTMPRWYGKYSSYFPSHSHTSPCIKLIGTLFIYDIYLLCNSRWKQRDIHEKREQRKFKIAQYEQELKNNDILYPKLVEITKQVADGGPPVFSATVERLKTQPSPEAPGPGQTKYDEMLHELMIAIWEECKKAGVDAKDEKLGDILVKQLEGHQQQLQNRQNLLREDIENEKAEQNKKITSDDIHDGFSASVRINSDSKPAEC
jgi:cell division cycle protein 37